MIPEKTLYYYLDKISRLESENHILRSGLSNKKLINKPTEEQVKISELESEIEDLKNKLSDAEYTIDKQDTLISELDAKLMDIGIIVMNGRT